MGEYKELFEFAAKAGALEGYLYERVKVEPLDNWVSNIEKMYASLPDNVKEDVRDEFSNVLRRILTNGGKVLEDGIIARLNKILSAI